MLLCIAFPTTRQTLLDANLFVSISWYLFYCKFIWYHFLKTSQISSLICHTLEYFVSVCYDTYYYQLTTRVGLNGFESDSAWFTWPSSYTKLTSRVRVSSSHEARCSQERHLHSLMRSHIWPCMWPHKQVLSLG